MVHILIFCAVLLSFTTDVIQCKCIKDDNLQLPDGITIHKVVGTWDEALLQCQSEGAVIASPINLKLLDAMKSLIAVRNTAYFLGTRTYYNNTGPFVSLEGIALDCMTSAVVNMIEKLDPLDGSCLGMDQHSIRVVPCSMRLPFMCHKAQIEHTRHKSTRHKSTRHKVTSTPTTEKYNVNKTSTQVTEQDTPTQLKKHKSTTGLASMKCSTGYTAKASTGKCYRLHDLDAYTTWDHAQAMCVAEGAHLAVIDDAIEAKAIDEIAALNPIVYVGLRYGDNEGWKSIHGTPVEKLYNEWYTDDHIKKLYMACATINFHRKLENFECDRVLVFICEKYPVHI